MGEALVKSSVFKIGKETTYGSAASSMTAIELAGVPTFNDSFDTIERNIVRQAFSSFAPIRGTERVTGSLQIEANEGLRHAYLYQGAFGYWQSASGGTDCDYTLTTTTSDTSITLTNSSSYTDPQMTIGTISVSSALGFHVGYPIVIYNTSTTPDTITLAGFITDISGTNITFITAHGAGSVAINASNAVSCGELFTLCDEHQTQVVSLPSYTYEYYRGNITKEQYLGCMISSMSLDMSTGQLIQPTFNWDGKTVEYSSDSDSSTPTSGQTPLVMRLSDIFMEDESGNVYQKCISNIQLELNNETFKKECVATSGVGKVIRTARSVTGSLNTFYEDKSLQDAFKANTSFKLRALIGYSSGTSGSSHTQSSSLQAGRVLAITIPNLKFSEIGIDEDTGIFKYNASFTCEPVNGDDEIALAWL